MSVTNTSRLAYQNSYPKHGTHRRIVLEVIKMLEVSTDFQIAELLGWKINSVTPRRNELVHSGLIEEKFEKIDPLTNTKVKWWHIKN